MRRSGHASLAFTAAPCLVTLLVTGFATGAPARSLRHARCRITQLELVVDPNTPSPKTGQNPLVLSLTNHGIAACFLRGYPDVWLQDRAGVIPFSIRHGNDQMVTGRQPRQVLIRPDGAAFVLLNNYRCDLGPRRAAQTLTLRLPATPHRAGNALTVLTHGVPRYCGQGDPGSIVVVSPFEPTITLTLNN